LIVIRIEKPDAPDVLQIAGKKQRRIDCANYSRNSEDYRSGQKTFDFKSSIYAHSTVKQVLIDCQFGKCCFCEQRIDADGDVEHFRPKQAYKQATGQPLQRPGYYWLAYEWHNLFLSCPSCNQRHKQNLFPLADPTQRATDHKSKVQEQPLFVDPSLDDPETLIGFHSERAYPIADNLRAKSTIENLRLNRRNLSESRLKYLKPLKILHKLVQYAAENPDDVGLQQFAQEAQQTLNEAVQNNSPFTASVRAAQKNDFRDVPG
jgi:uncharacterized protein (TIGR02646 family)